ncbi:MAG: PaaI family thioesterase [Bacteroidetes bacterium]|nr:PaaI family thioesterase [Bacteroidota bacterium]
MILKKLFDDEQKILMSIKDIVKKLQKIENQLPYNTFVSDGNNNRINTSFYFDKDSKSGYLEVIFGDLCIGPPGFAHGGAIASVFDEAMGVTAWLNAHKVMTAKLEINYLKPVPLNTKILGEFSIENIKGRTVKIGGRLVSEDEGTLFAAANGIFVVVNAKKFENKLNQDASFNKFKEFLENHK